MKKLILTILLCCSLVILTNGCKKEEDNYEHYNLLTNEDTTYYNMATPEGWSQNYAIANITPEYSEGFEYGLFYELKDDDYILLEKFNDKIGSELYDNKLYILYGHKIYEYSLNREKVDKKKLDFQYYKSISPATLHNIENDYIYIYALTDDDNNEHIININLRCSLKDLKCETYED